MLTITAPGERPHNRLDFVSGRGRAEHFICGCDERLVDAGLWNRSASRRWNRLLTALRRRYPGLQFVRAVEVQARGLIHYHLAVACPVALDLVWVRDEAVRCGFGCSLDWQDVANPRYLAKYVTKSLEAQGLSWSEVNLETGEVVAVEDPRLRTMSRSAAWGVTLAMLRARRRDEARARADRLRTVNVGLTVDPASSSDVGPGPALPAPDP
jgi:hypothetical protein